MSRKKISADPSGPTTNAGDSADLRRYYAALARIAESECCCSENGLPDICPHSIALIALSRSNLPEMLCPTRRDGEIRLRGDEAKPIGLESDRENPKREEITERMAYSIEEAAQLLGLHYFSVYRLVQRGKLRACRALRGKLLIPRAELLKLLRAEY
jgi:excisionase family DNA binding protein